MTIPEYDFHNKYAYMVLNIYSVNSTQDKRIGDSAALYLVTENISSSFPDVSENFASIEKISRLEWLERMRCG